MKQSNMSFDVESIHRNFLDVQSHFKKINEQLSCKRDLFDDDVMDNLLHAYRFINERLAKNPKKHLIDYNEMLELNTIVLNGIDRTKRMEYVGSIKAAKEKSLLYIDDFMKWYERHEHSKDDPYKIAAGLYVRILAQPQLFVEGNHRTGALVANYHLLMAGQMPFILTTSNAVDFFNLASDVKFKNMSIKSRFRRATGWHDEKTRMSAFLKSHAMAFTSTGIPAREEIRNSAIPRQRPGDSLNL